MPPHSSWSSTGSLPKGNPARDGACLFCRLPLSTLIEEGQRMRPKGIASDGQTAPDSGRIGGRGVRVKDGFLGCRVSFKVTWPTLRSLTLLSGSHNQGVSWHRSIKVARVGPETWYCPISSTFPPWLQMASRIGPDFFTSHVNTTEASEAAPIAASPSLWVSWLPRTGLPIRCCGLIAV